MKQHAEKRIRVLFSGRVQGVGFRFAVCRLAESRGVVGLVRNLPDGDVELIAEGDEDRLSELVGAIFDSRPGAGIANAETTWSPAEGGFDRFRIAR